MAQPLTAVAQVTAVTWVQFLSFWPGNFHMPVGEKKKKKTRGEKEEDN